MKVLQLHLWIQNKRETWTEPEVLRFSKLHPQGRPSRGKGQLNVGFDSQKAHMKYTVVLDAKLYGKSIDGNPYILFESDDKDEIDSFLEEMLVVAKKLLKRHTK